MAPILSLREIEKLRPQLNDVVLIGGVFDIIHGGHIDHFKEAKSLGKTLIVHVTSDKRVKIKKGANRPIFSQDERAKIVAAMRYVDYVFIDDMPHYDTSLLEIVRPDVLFLNHEAVSEQIKNYLEGIKPSVKVVVSSSPKINTSSKIMQKIQSAAEQKTRASVY